MKSLTQHLNEQLIINQRFDEKLVIFPQQVDEKLVIFPQQVDEKLVINKNYNYNSLDDIYKVEWRTNQYGVCCKDKDNFVSNIFYEYFTNSAKKKITFAQQCRYVNDGDYLCASKEIGNGSHLMCLFHLNGSRTNDSTDLYSKFVFIPIHNGMRIEYEYYALKKDIFSLSRTSSFSKEGSTQEYYLVSEDTWDEIKIVYKNLCRQ